MSVERFGDVYKNPDSLFAAVFSAEKNPKRIAIVFPGQGWQTVGMGRELYDSDDEVQKIYETADNILGYKISRLSFAGPEDYLNRTLYAQPAIFILNHVNYVLMMRSGIKPQFVAGSSLGEYNAVVASGAMSFEDMLKVVQARAEATDYANTVNPGGMIAFGVPYEEGDNKKEKKKLLEKGKKLFTNSGLFVEAINSEFQIVLSGLDSDIERLGPIINELRALGLKIKVLNVKGPFHSPYMKLAEEGLTKALNEAPMQKAQIPLIANTTAGIITRPEEIKRELIDHLTMPVLWDETMRFLNKAGIAARPLEVGGKMLLKMRENPKTTAAVATFVVTAFGAIGLAYRLKNQRKIKH